MNPEHRQVNGVGYSFDAWAARIYPGQIVVNKSTGYLQMLRSRMLCVIDRIDDELNRRDKGQQRAALLGGRAARKIKKAE
jgi:hypothetical protein